MKEITGAPHGLAVLTRESRPPMTIKHMEAAHQRFIKHHANNELNDSSADSIIRFVGNIYRSVSNLSSENIHYAYNMASFWEVSVKKFDGRILMRLDDPPYVGVIKYFKSVT